MCSIVTNGAHITPERPFQKTESAPSDFFLHGTPEVPLPKLRYRGLGFIWLKGVGPKGYMAPGQ
eukprot:5433625-Amphidinium_carterae.1